MNFMKFIVLFCFLFFGLMNIGCSQNNVKSQTRVTNCTNLRSANSIVVVEGRTKLIYDKRIDKECGSK